jgi:Bacterial lectin
MVRGFGLVTRSAGSICLGLVGCLTVMAPAGAAQSAWAASDPSSSSGQTVVQVTARPTTSAVSCQQTALAVGQSTTCTTTVTDTGPGQAITPAGTVRVSGHLSDSFAGSPCTLTGSGGTASCQVIYTPIAFGLGQRTITAAYYGDETHHGSHGSTTVNVAVDSPNLGGETFESSGPPDTGSPCGPGSSPTFAFKTSDISAAGMYAPGFAISGTLNAITLSGQAVFSISDSLGRVLARGAMTLSGGEVFCQEAGDLVQLNGSSFAYTARIFTTSGVRYDTGTGDLRFSNLHGDSGYLSAAFRSTKPALTSVIDYPDFSTTAGLALNGSAAQVGGALRLTDGGGSAGSVWSLTPVYPAESFATTVTLGSSGPDGFALVIQRDPAGAGALGTQLGYGGITPSLAVYFKPSSDSFPVPVSVYEDGTLAAVPPSPFGTCLDFTPPAPFTIDYNAATHELDITGNSSGGPCVFTVNVPLDLQAVLGGPAPALAGLTASSTSGGTAQTQLDSWQLSQPAINRTARAFSRPRPRGVEEYAEPTPLHRKPAARRR